MIRAYQTKDMPRIKALLEVMHDHSPYKEVEIDWPRVQSMLAEAIVHDALVVSELNNKIDGFIICAAKTLWWNTRIKIGSDVFFLPGKDGKGLLDALVKWCRDRRVWRIECGISSFTRLEDVKEIYTAAGFNREGSLFTLYLRDDSCPA